jgi:hypothetical protein
MRRYDISSVVWMHIYTVLIGVCAVLSARMQTHTHTHARARAHAHARTHETG